MSRKLNVLELRLHQTALADSGKTLTRSPREADLLFTDATARTAALNFLLGTGLLKLLKTSDHVTGYRAVTKKELEIKKDMSGEENMVLSHTQASGNEGIWTKHLKGKTEQQQTVIDRCLKALMQKPLIKSIKAIKHPTRKIYMLFHLQPSVEITELPQIKTNRNQSPHWQPLFPIGGALSYPNAKQIQGFLDKCKITETELTVEHVEMLLNVLILDGEIEKVPSFGAAMWESKRRLSEVEDDEDVDDGRKKRKNSKDAGNYKRRWTSRIDDESSNSDAGSSKRGKKRRKGDHSDTASGDESESVVRKKKRRLSIRDDSDSDQDHSRRRKDKGKKRLQESESSQSESETEDEDNHRSRSRSRSTSSRRKASRKRSLSPTTYAFDSADLDDSFGGAYVYRAIRQERVALGWSQAPCGGCPVFDFCKDKGPVNPRECNFCEDWLRVDPVKTEF